MSTWETCDYWNAPECAGVYAVCVGVEVVYVGSSGRLKNRLRAHRVIAGYAKNVETPWGTVNGTTDYCIKIKRSRRFGDWLMIEMRLIRRLKPRFNTAGVNPRKAWRVA